MSGWWGGGKGWVSKGGRVNSGRLVWRPCHLFAGWVCVWERERERERERKSERERKKIDASPRNVAFPRETSIGWCFVHFTVRSTSTLRSHTVLWTAEDGCGFVESERRRKSLDKCEFIQNKVCLYFMMISAADECATLMGYHGGKMNCNHWIVIFVYSCKV